MLAEGSAERFHRGRGRRFGRLSDLIEAFSALPPLRLLDGGRAASWMVRRSAGNGSGREPSGLWVSLGGVLAGCAIAFLKLLIGRTF